MASVPASFALSVSSSASVPDSTPAQGSLESAGAGITGGMSCQNTYLRRYHETDKGTAGYTGDSLNLKIIIAFLLGLALYNAIELLVLVFLTFQRFRGLYFWSLVVSASGIIPYALGFLIKFFQLLDPGRDEGYVAVVLLTVGWYLMVTGEEPTRKGI